MGFAHRLLNLRAGNSAVRSSPEDLPAQSKLSRFGYVFLELREIYLVVGIGDGVVVLQIVRLLLIGHERGHAFQHEVEMVGAPFHVGLEFGHAELSQGRDEALGRVQQRLCGRRWRILSSCPCRNRR